LLSGSHRWGRRGDYHIDVEPNEFCGEIGQSFELAVGISGLDYHTFPFNVAELAQTWRKASV